MRTSATVIVLLAAGLAGGSSSAPAQEAPRPVEETLEMWNHTADKVVAMAENFPEDKYDFKPSSEVRSFREQLLHVAGANYFFLRQAGAQKTKAGHPGRETKADVVAVVKESFGDGAAFIREQGEDGLRRMVKHPLAERNISIQALLLVSAHHAGEHYGQLVVYYRLNGLVPPASR
ncbi:MAG: DinB family protein [Candidatus Acidiferrales bacterium]